MKPKLQQRLQEGRDTRNMECLLKKATGHKCSDAKRKAVAAEAVGLGPSQPGERHSLSPQAKDVTYGAPELDVCFALTQFLYPYSSLWRGNFTWAIVHLDYVNCFYF